MKAVRFHAAKNIRVEDVPAPSKKLGSNDVLIKPLVTGICGTDLHEYIAGPIVTPVAPHIYTGAPTRKFWVMNLAPSLPIQARPSPMSKPATAFPFSRSSRRAMIIMAAAASIT